MKRFSGIILLLCICLVARGQGNMYSPEGQDPKVFTGSLLMGVNFSQVDGDSYYGYHKVGVNVGAMVYVHLGDLFGLSMELLYSRKGSAGITDTSSPALGQYIAKYYMYLNYIEVPVMVHFVAGKFDFETGVSYARLVSSDEYIIADPPYNINQEAAHFNNTDYDFNLGFTTRVYKNLFVNARYQYSLSSIRPPERIPVGYSYGNRGQYNNLFNLRLVYTF